MTKPPTRAKAIRLKCLDCGTTSKAVKFCTSDGKLSTQCPLWPYRFGCGPATAAKRHGSEFVTTGALPPPSTDIEECQKGPRRP